MDESARRHRWKEFAIPIILEIEDKVQEQIQFKSGSREPHPDRDKNIAKLVDQIESIYKDIWDNRYKPYT